MSAAVVMNHLSSQFLYFAGFFNFKKENSLFCPNYFRDLVGFFEGVGQALSA